MHCAIVLYYYEDEEKYERGEKDGFECVPGVIEHGFEGNQLVK